MHERLGELHAGSLVHLPRPILGPHVPPRWVIEFMGHPRTFAYPAGKCVAPAMACLLSATGRGLTEYTRIFGEAINGLRVRDKKSPQPHGTQAVTWARMEEPNASSPCGVNQPRHFRDLASFRGPPKRNSELTSAAHSARLS